MSRKWRQGNGRPQGWGMERVFSKTQPCPQVPSTWPPVCERLLWEAGPPSGPSSPVDTSVWTALMQGLSQCPAWRKS